MICKVPSPFLVSMALGHRSITVASVKQYTMVSTRPLISGIPQRLAPLYGLTPILAHVNLYSTQVEGTQSRALADLTSSHNILSPKIVEVS